MKKTIWIYLFAICASLSAEEIGGVNFRLNQPHEKWIVGNEYRNEQQELVTYVREKEATSQWEELFTAQVIRGLNLSPKAFFDMFIKQLNGLSGGKNIQNKIIKHDDNELLAEWWIKDKTDQDQYEWVRLMQNGKSLVVLRFTTKNVDQIELVRSKANSVLNSAQRISS